METGYKLWPHAPHGKEKDSTSINKSTQFFTSNRNKIKGNNSGDGYYIDR